MADGKTFEYGQAASEVQFQDNPGILKNSQGEAVLEVTDDQNVGIGTDTPASPNGNERCLEIKGASVGLVLDSTNGSAGNWEIQHNSGDLKFQREAVNAATFNTSGNLGLGTDGPDRKLDILDASNPQLRLTQADASKFVDLEADSTGRLNVRSETVAALVVRSSNVNSNIYVTADDDDYDQALTGGSAGPALIMGLNKTTNTGRIRMEGNSTQLNIGVTGSQDAIVIDASKNATFVANLTADGNVTLGDASGDAHTVNGTMTVPDGLTYRPTTIVNAAAANTAVTVAQTGTTIVLTDKDGYCTLPSVVAADIGIQFVVMNASEDDNSDCIRGDGSDNFYYADKTDGETSNQEVGAMKAKTVVCFAADSWIVIG